MQRPRILVIEDEPAIREGVADALDFAGYDTLLAATGDDGLESALGAGIDLILLDLVLPWKNDAPESGGLEILRQVRRTRPTLPVIILTALGQESQRVRGLKMGADDYVPKPFSINELLARVQAVLRRSPQRPTDLAQVSFTGGVANFARCELCFDDGARQDLTQREMMLLRYLSQNSERAVSREELLSHVWEIDPQGVETRAVDMQIARLREKLRDTSTPPAILTTVRGKGYMLATTQTAQSQQTPEKTT